MNLLRPALSLFALFTVLTGVAYPLLVTGVAQALFAHQANGSPIERDGVVIGSELIGQSFTAPSYVWSRPSATAAHPYDASASTGSNLGPTNPALVSRVEAELAHLSETGTRTDGEAVPVDLVTTSGSGLDPHISPAAALLQAGRVARSRGVDVAEVRRVIEAHIEAPALGLFGAPRVNVLQLNLALDDTFGRLAP
jgi:K+-transporting ATPase ATPase C chain